MGRELLGLIGKPPGKEEEELNRGKPKEYKRYDLTFNRTFIVY
jgi:hypothetical protein